MRKDCSIIIMAKAPVAGAVKTRLMPCYSAAEACCWHERMCRSVMAQAQCLFERVVVATDDCTHPFWQDSPFLLLEQGRGDLGERLQRIAVMQQDHLPLIILGTDSPHMEDARLLQAADALQHHDVVIGPVEDGGYNLIGISRDIPHLFEATDWGSARVCEQTCRQAAAYRVAMLGVDFDIDTADDLRRSLSPPHRWFCDSEALLPSPTGATKSVATV